MSSGCCYPGQKKGFTSTLMEKKEYDPLAVKIEGGIEELTEDDLFREGWEETLGGMLEDQALEDYAEEADAAGVEMDDFFFSAPYPNGNFSVGKEGITWYFNPYDIAPYALGVIDVTLSWDQLKPLLK